MLVTGSATRDSAALSRSPLYSTSRASSKQIDLLRYGVTSAWDPPRAPGTGDRVRRAVQTAFPIGKSTHTDHGAAFSPTCAASDSLPIRLGKHADGFTGKSGFGLLPLGQDHFSELDFRKSFRKKEAWRTERQAKDRSGKAIGRPRRLTPGPWSKPHRRSVSKTSA